MSSSPLPNYLRPHRKRLGLSQEEVAFLLGFRGESKGAGVCKDERFERVHAVAPCGWPAVAREEFLEARQTQSFLRVMDKIAKERGEKFNG